MEWFYNPRNKVLQPTFIGAKLRNAFFYRTAAQYSYKFLVKVNRDSFLNLDGFSYFSASSETQQMHAPFINYFLSPSLHQVTLFRSISLFFHFNFLQYTYRCHLHKFFDNFLTFYCQLFSLPFHPTNQFQEFREEKLRT